MDFLAFALIVMVAGSIYYYFKQKLSYFKNHGVPYEPGLPVFGNMMPVVFGRKHVSEMILDIYNANPTAKYVGAFNFGQASIVLRDPELIKTIAIKEFDNFQNRSSLTDEKVDPFLSIGIFHAKGERWREIRNLLCTAFTSSKLKSMFELMVECCKNFNAHVSALSDEEKEEVATKDLFGKYTADVIASCIFDLATDTFKNPNNQLYIVGKKSATFEGLSMLKFHMATLCPRLMRLFNIKVIGEDTASFFKSTVRNVIETRDREGIGRPDVIQLLMDARGVDRKHTKLDVRTITAQTYILFIRGFRATSTQMCTIARELALNPSVQRKVQGEIDKLAEETDGQVSYEAMQKMPYFDAVFNESLRRHTDAILLTRECEKPFELPAALPGGKPFVVQPRTNIWILAKAIHMDSKYYSDPRQFKPQRYYQKKMTNNDALNLAFGIGPRGCIAHRFARLQTKILFFRLLSEFNLVANGATNLPIKYCTDSINVKPERGFNLSIERRIK